MGERRGKRERPAPVHGGSSLVEVLVAMTLVLVLVVGAAGMLGLALAAKRKGDVTAALAHALTDRLEALKSRPFDDPELAAGEYAATGRVEPGACLISSSWRIEDEGDGAKRITLRVRSAGRPGPETTAVAFVLRDLGFAP
jgi:Tfp pilus assembly protein PilV